MRTKIVMTRQFTKNNVEEFKNLLSKGLCYEVLYNSELNSSFKAFMYTFLYYFNIAFTYKRVKSMELMKDGSLMDY
jgi:uncharacterized membrane protein YobD (UPF0266 family)